MKSIKCNIIKAGRGDVYGRPFAIGQIYTGPFDYVRQLVSCGYATVDDAAVFDDDSTPQNSEIAIVGKGRMAVEAELNEVTGGLIFTAGGQDISAMIGAGSNPIVARQYTEAQKTDADVVATTLFSHVFQPGSVVAGDSIVVDGLFSYPSSATLKKLRCKIGATNFLVYDASTSQSFEWRIKIRMRSLVAQVAHASGSSAGGFGIIGSADPIEAALDFAIAQTLEVTAEWGTAGAGSNAIVLEAVDVRVERLAV